MKKTLDINTLEGWNEMIRQYNIKELIEKGIEPTEENIEKYEIERLKAYEGNRNLADTHIVPTYYYVDDIRFSTEEQALEYKESLKKATPAYS